MSWERNGTRRSALVAGVHLPGSRTFVCFILERNPIMCNADPLHPSKIPPHSATKLDMVALSAWNEWRSTRKRQSWHNLEDPFIEPVVQKHMTISTNCCQPVRSHGFNPTVSPIQLSLADAHGCIHSETDNTDRPPKVRCMSCNKRQRMFNGLHIQISQVSRYRQTSCVLFTASFGWG
jgi:hypothetical protein